MAKFSRERVAFSVKVEWNAVHVRHRGHLSKLKWSLILFHLFNKFNRKCESLSLVLVRRLAGAIGVAEEDQVVLAGGLHSTGYVQGHGLVFLVATNAAGFHRPASLVPELPIILTKRTSRGEVKG